MRRFKRNHVSMVIGVTLFTIFVLVGIMFFSGIWTTSSTYDVSAYVTNARGIAQDSTVFEAGLPVGLVNGITRKGPDAIIDLRITSGPTPLPTDTTIRLGLRSLAGEADVELFPGHSTQTIRNGGSLGLTQDQDYTEVDQILNQLSGPTEGTARQTFQGLGNAVNGQGQNLNQTIGGAAGLINNSPPLTSELAAQHAQVANIVQNLGGIMQAIGDRTQAVQQFASGSLTTFNALAARDNALRSTITELPDILNSIRSTAGALTATSPHIAPVLAKLATAVTALKPTIDLLTPAAQHGITLVNSLGNASPAVRNILRNLDQTKPAATTALPAIHATTCQLNPMLRYISPYGRDVASFFQQWEAMFDMYDVNGHMLFASVHAAPTDSARGVEGQSLVGVTQTLLNAGIFAPLAPGYGFRPYLPPGQIDNPTIGLGDSTPAQWGATHTYPHVTADCSK
jgi:phospholipid/cholesterol/gamma-HCH transport system substrate-binding protein